MSEQEVCPDCGGELEWQAHGIYYDEMCRDCGLITDSKELEPEEQLVDVLEGEEQI